MLRLLFLLAITTGCLLNANAQRTVYYNHDGSGNRDTRSITLSKSAEEQGTDSLYKDLLGEFQVFIYPNPTEGNLKVVLYNLREGSSPAIQVYNIQGKLILDIPNALTENCVDLSNQISGTYQLVLIVKDIISTWQIVKE